MIENSAAQTTRPCDETWDSLDGSAKVRYCYKCKRNIYNLDGLDASEAKSFVERMEGVAVEGLFQREDGKYLVADQVGARASVKARVALALSTGIAAVALIGATMNDLADLSSASPMAQTPSVSQQMPQSDSHEHDAYQNNGGDFAKISLERVRRAERRVAWRKQLFRERHRFVG